MAIKALAKSLTNFIERMQVSGENLRVDREAGVIHGAKILGTESRYSNGKVRRRYSESAIEQAAKAYEGLGFNTNHPDRKTPDVERGVEERVGWFESVTSKSDGVYADLHCIKSHPFTPILMEIAERNPAMIGLSHNADGVETVQKNGERLVESIDRVISVDLVQKPATNSSLFESEEPMPQTLKKFVESIDAKHPLQAGMSRLLEEDPVMAELPAPEMPAASSSEDQIKAAFRQAVMAAFDDEALDSKATLSKIKDILKAYDKLTGSSSAGGTGADSGSESGGADSSGSTPAIESMAAEIRSLKAKDGIRSMMESEGLAPSEERVNLLSSVAGISAQKSLIATFKKADASEKSVVAKPKSGRFTESQESGITADKIPTDPKEFVKFASGPRR